MFWESFMSPANVAHAQSVTSELLTPNVSLYPGNGNQKDHGTNHKQVQGRIDVSRTIDGAELNTEYLFGLFTNLVQDGKLPESMSLVGIPQSYVITHFAANGNTASASTIIQFSFPSFGLTLPVEIDTWKVWDANCQVIQYDATFRWFEYLLDTLLQAKQQPTTGDVDDSSKEMVIGSLSDGLAASICSIHDTYCTSDLRQYNSTEYCNQFLTKQTRFGAAYEMGRNTLLCRMIHQNLVPSRPEVHCSHIGPSGGGMCSDDSTYAQKVEQQYFKGPFMPFGDE
jgi:hypothetical protein